MMIIEDWVKDAALDIQRMDRPTIVEICDAIERHSPLKKESAYMPVPRCDGCKLWSVNPDGKTGFCGLREEQSCEKATMYPEMYDGIITTADFGCVRWEAK